MKRAVIAFAAVSLLFCGLWLYEKNDLSDMERMCQSYAGGAAATMNELVKIKERDGEWQMGNYRHTVSQFYAFMETLAALIEDRHDAQYEDCSVVYDHMILAPEEVLAHIDETLAAMELLGEDYDSPQAKKALNELAYNLQYVWES